MLLKGRSPGLQPRESEVKSMLEGCKTLTRDMLSQFENKVEMQRNEYAK